MIQIRSEGVDSGTVEIKTWTFMPEGAMVTTEVLRDNQLFPVVSDQVMARVDEVMYNLDQPSLCLSLLRRESCVDITERNDVNVEG